MKIEDKSNSYTDLPSKANNTSIKSNIEALREQVSAACRRSGRAETSVKLVAVSKTKPAEAVYEAYCAGVAAFGENYVQELLAKSGGGILGGLAGIEWHMIGHLQTNKVKQLIGKTALIHSLDSMRLAGEIEKQAEKTSVTVDALIEVNIAKEAGKFGFFAEEACAAAERIAPLRHIKVHGLMASAPFTENPENNRIFFRQLYELYLDIGRSKIDNVDMCILSMGMSNDFLVAIEEGSTLVRIGTRIFGRR